MLPVGSSGLLHFDSFSLRVQFAVSASLSCGQLDPVSRFLHSLVKFCLRDKREITDQSVVAFHFPFVFHCERERRMITFVIIKIIVRGKRRAVFTFL